MHEEARRKDLCEKGYMGGLIIDEMAIRADFEITKPGDVIELVGLFDVGKEGNLSNMLKKGKQERTVGTHALQLSFSGSNRIQLPNSTLHFRWCLSCWIIMLVLGSG